MLLGASARVGADRRQGQAGERFFEKAFEVFPAHLILELQALNAGLREAPAPVPCFQLA